jgi:hypothetical protein
MPAVINVVSIPNYLGFLDSFNENSNNLTLFFDQNGFIKTPSLKSELFNLINLSNVLTLNSIKKCKKN